MGFVTFKVLININQFLLLDFWSFALYQNEYYAKVVIG